MAMRQFHSIDLRQTNAKDDPTCEKLLLVENAPKPVIGFQLKPRSCALKMIEDDVKEIPINFLFDRYLP